MEIYLGSLLAGKYEFRNYIKFQGVDYPKTIIKTGYQKAYNKRSIIGQISTYNVVSIDNKSINSIGFDTERPPKGAYIQDMRNEFKKNRPNGLIYKYNDTKRTLTETSAILAGKGQKH